MAGSRKWNRANGGCELDHISATEVENWITARVAELVNIELGAVARDEKFDSYGIDSAKAITLMVDLEEWLQLPDELPLELLFEAESIHAAAASIAAAITLNDNIQSLAISDER